MFSLFLSVLQRKFGEEPRLDQEGDIENFSTLFLSLSVKLPTLCSRTAPWKINEGNKKKERKKEKVVSQLIPLN
jgi:hypothetical protein